MIFFTLYFTCINDIIDEAYNLSNCTSECRDTLKGEGYIGSTSHTINGTRCLRWDSLNRSNSKYASILKLKGNITSHENYCRNPDEKLAPWCYIGVDNGLWEYCDIPFCKQSWFS